MIGKSGVILNVFSTRKTAQGLRKAFHGVKTPI